MFKNTIIILLTIFQMVILIMTAQHRYIRIHNNKSKIEMLN